MRSARWLAAVLMTLASVGTLADSSHHIAPAAEEPESAVEEASTCPETRRVRHCISGKILYVTTISYEGPKCQKTQKVQRTRTDHGCPVGTKYSQTACTRDGWHVESSVTYYMDDCQCKHRRVENKKRCMPECAKPKSEIKCIDNNLYRVESGESIVDFACQPYARQEALKPDCTVGVIRRRGVCQDLYMNVTEVTTTYRECNCQTSTRQLKVQCACPMTKERAKCEGVMKMRMSTVYRLTEGSCRPETSVQRIPIACPNERLKSSSGCRADCTETVTHSWTEIRNCRCIRPIKKTTVKCCCPKPQHSSFCRSNVLHAMVRSFHLSNGQCKEKVKTTKKPITCNQKFPPEKSSCAFNGYRRVTLYTQERRGCVCVKRRRITYEKCGCGKDYKTEECNDNVWIVRSVTHKQDAAKSTCDRKVDVKKTPTRCRGKLDRKVSKCQPDGYRVVKQTIEEAQDCACVTRVVSERERCSCPKSSSEVECRNNRVYKHRLVQHLVDGKCIPRRTTSVVRIRCGENTVKDSACVKGWRTKTYVNYYPYNCKCTKRVYNRQERCACPKGRKTTSCVRGVIVQSEVRYEMKDGQCIGHSCKVTRRVHCPRSFEVKRGKCVSNNRLVTVVETRRRDCACKTFTSRSTEVCGCPKPEVKRKCSKDQVESVITKEYKLVDGTCLVEEKERVIPNRCPTKPLYRRGVCNRAGYREDTWIHHSLRNCLCSQKVKRVRMQCRCPQPKRESQCVKHKSLEKSSVTYTLVRGVCKRSVAFERTPIYCLNAETPIFGRCRGGSAGRSSGLRLITYVKYENRNCECVKRTRVKKIPCDCQLLNYRVKKCENSRKTFVISEYRFTDAASECKRTVKVTKQPIDCSVDRKQHRSACGKEGYLTVTLTFNHLVNCVCIKQTQTRRVVCRCPKTKVEVKADYRIKWNVRCETTYSLNLAKNVCDHKTLCNTERKDCMPQMADPEFGHCDQKTGFQRIRLTLGKVVLLPPPQDVYVCQVDKIVTSKRCACPKQTKKTECRRNVLVTVTVSQTLRGETCIKTQRIDKKATECPKPTVTETNCKADNSKVETTVSYDRLNCKCVKRVKHRSVLCRCPEPISSARCDGHSTSITEIISYRLREERCHREKREDRTEIKCQDGTQVVKAKCDKSSCNQQVTRTTKFTRDCKCHQKVDIATIKCCCHPETTTKVKCFDHSRQVIINTTYRLVKGVCHKSVNEKGTTIACTLKPPPIRGPCKPDGYRQVTFVSYALRNCKCVKVERQTNELCNCPKSHSETSCEFEKWVTRVTEHRLIEASSVGGKSNCTKSVRTIVKSPNCLSGRKVESTRCQDDDYKRITTTVRYQKDCKCLMKVETRKKRCRCPKSTKRLSCRGHNVIHLVHTSYRLRGDECPKDEKTVSAKVVCYEKEKPERSPCGDDGYRRVKLVSYVARDCKCVRQERFDREICSCPKDYKARECRNNYIVSTYVKYVLTPKECLRRSRITKERPKCDEFVKNETKGDCRSDGFQSIFFEQEKLVNCECRKQVETKQIRCRCPKPRVERRCLDNQVITTRTTFQLSGGHCHSSKKNHSTKVQCPGAVRVIRHKCSGKRRIIEYIKSVAVDCACKAVSKKVTKPCSCPKPSTTEEPCLNGRQRVVTVYYIKDRDGDCKKMSDVDTQVCAERKTCRCDALGDPHFLMYDGVPLHFQGECKYTLTKLRNTEDKCAFDVEVKNEHRDGNLNYTYVRLMDVRLFGHVYRLHQHKRVFVDGKISSLPYSENGVRIFYSGPYVQFVASKCHFTAAFDGQYSGYVEVDKEYAGRMVGICGNCNGKTTDDYVTKDGVDVIAKQSGFERDNLVGDSFRVRDDSDAPVAKCKDTPILPVNACSNTWMPKARALCRRLTDPAGPFGRCLAVGRVPALALFNDCITDACVNRPRLPKMLQAVCEAHRDMAEQCAEAGFPGVSWRSRDFCPLECDRDKVYTTLMHPCPRTCENLFFGTKADCYHLPKREGCACREGLVLDGRKCVSPEMCKCVKKFPDLMCKDTAPKPQCEQWRKSGHCASNPYTMLKMCRETCELCHKRKAKNACRNVMSQRRCHLLKQEGQCGNSFVSTACRRTCGVCRPEALKPIRAAGKGSAAASSTGHADVHTGH